MIEFKFDHLKQELDSAPLLLKLIVDDMAKIMDSMFKPCVITRILGKLDGDSGIHADHRAVDIRDQYMNRYSFKETERTKILEAINLKYNRTDGIPTVIWHSFMGLPYHFHVQIAVDTRVYRNKEA